jgi:large subunit ribosomal protein L28
MCSEALEQFEETSVAGRCELCGKKIAFGHNVSHSHHKTGRVWRPNVQKTILVLGGKLTRVHACTRCIRTSRKQVA